MKKKILFILNTYNFQSNFLKKNLSLNQNYLRFNKEDQNWFNYFYNNLKKDFFLKKDYPNLNKTILGENYCEFLQKKINRFKPHLIFSNVNDKNIENLLSKYNNTKKIIWVSHLISKKKLKYYKNIFEYLITDNDHIYKQARYLKFKVFNFRISAPAYIKLNKKDFIKRRSEIYFSGSLGYNFQNRFDILNFLNNNFKIKHNFLTIIKMIKNSITKILEKIFQFNQTFSNSKLLEKRLDEQQKFIELSVKENRELKNDISKINSSLNKILDSPNNILENSNNNLENKISENLGHNSIARVDFYQEENVRLGSELLDTKKKFEILKSEIEKYEEQRSNLISKINSVNDAINDTNVLTNVFDNNVKPKINITDHNKIEKKDKGLIDLNEQVKNIFSK